MVGCRCIGSRGIGLDLRVGSNTLIGDISNISVVVVSGVLHMLDPAIGKSNRVGSENIAGSITRLSSIEGSLGVVILDSILVGVGLRDISIGRSWGISRLGSIGRGRDWQGSRGRGICWGRRRRSRDWSIGWCRGICRRRRRRGRRKRCIGLRGIGLGGVGRSRPVGASRVGTSHSHQSGEQENLKSYEIEIFSFVNKYCHREIWYYDTRSGSDIADFFCR
jgi:hypothetical protein